DAIRGYGLDAPRGLRLGVDAAHDPLHVAVGVDEERRALEGSAAFAVDAVVVAGHALRIGEERERELVLRLELHVRGLRVGAHAEDDGAALAKRVVCVADPARLLRAAGRVVAGVKIQYN